VLCLFCAYPENTVDTENGSHEAHICCTHTTEIGGWAKPSTEIFYRKTVPLIPEGNVTFKIISEKKEIIG
jgi:hypothetical protein